MTTVSGDMSGGTAPIIAHHVDLILDEQGEVEMAYNYLTYAWGDPIALLARAYLDDIGAISIQYGTPDAEILAYLKARYARIDRLTASGYETVWTA